MHDDAHRLLHELRLRGVLSEEASDAADPASVRALEEAGYAGRTPRGLLLTTAGRDADAAWARLADGSADEVAARQAYERFLALNPMLLRVCSDWQVQPGGVPNDHRDPGYDHRVIERLAGIDRRVAPVLERLADQLARFSGYRAALRVALERVQADEQMWFTSPVCDSYHTVWMRLHEDLLSALGIDRAAEAVIEANATGA